MILCDTGPLIAIIDRDDSNHNRCVDALDSLPPTPLVTTWPCLTEALHLLYRVNGAAAQSELWMLLADGLVRLYAPLPDEWRRCEELMRQYSDLPMDFADASLVAAAESLRRDLIFTIDKHFYVYRKVGDGEFQIVP